MAETNQRCGLSPGYQSVPTQLDVIDVMLNGVILLDIRLTGEPIVYVNQRFCELTGYGPEQVLGRNPKLLHGADTDSDTIARINTAVAKSSEITCEILYYKSDRTPFWSLMQLSPVVARDGKVSHYVVVLVDITHQKRTETEMAALRSDLAHLSRVTMANELSGTLAHQINQPLAAILANAQAARTLLKANPIDLTQFGEIIQDIITDNKIASSVVQRLRTFIRKGKSATELLKIDQLVTEIIEFTRENLTANHLQLHIDLADNLPSIRGDKVQLQQVVLNLINNACEAMENTPLEDRLLHINAFLSDSGRVAVRISDNGEGILPEDEAKIFQAFFTTKNRGLGLGLSICRSIIEKHGGRLFFDRKPNGGCVFGFDLPVMGLEIHNE
ncbi:PAS domain-containing protein [Exilibacterium tricleocarpae]|uniref:histidine kinase n=1 Tax=Exilibacterium tricleocarpae TaxID=2591008 RepID=A0A545U9V0_9GAMM|nr:ATP-binding protein [Exilibacterium tricleocarpae]TQV86250.1 PAS domain-containing protein [Exilibacterium tricleocarpae]